jgi:hypothetical protein
MPLKSETLTMVQNSTGAAKLLAMRLYPLPDCKLIFMPIEGHTISKALPLDKTSKTYVVACVDWLGQCYPTNNHNGLTLRSGGGEVPCITRHRRLPSRNRRLKS